MTKEGPKEIEWCIRGGGPYVMFDPKGLERVEVPEEIKRILLEDALEDRRSGYKDIGVVGAEVKDKK